ncbi:MAG: hypothetical protein ACRDH2_14965 [Anaerolineales bacterium]
MRASNGGGAAAVDALLGLPLPSRPLRSKARADARPLVVRASCPPHTPEGSKPGASRRAVMQAGPGIEPGPPWQALRGEWLRHST